MGVSGSEWTNGHCDFLRQWWSEGKTSRDIAKLFAEQGICYSRNAVIGKIHRLQLPPPLKKMVAPRVRNTTRIPKEPVRKILAPPLIANIKVIAEEIEAVKKPVNGHEVKKNKEVLLLETKDGHCRAIVGYRDGEKHLAVCCGDDTIMKLNNGSLKRSSWCEYHHAKFTYMGKR